MTWFDTRQNQQKGALSIAVEYGVNDNDCVVWRDLLCSNCVIVWHGGKRDALDVDEGVHDEPIDARRLMWSPLFHGWFPCQLPILSVFLHTSKLCDPCCIFVNKVAWAPSWVQLPSSESLNMNTSYGCYIPVILWKRHHLVRTRRKPDCNRVCCSIKHLCTPLVSHWMAKSSHISILLGQNFVCRVRLE